MLIVIANLPAIDRPVEGIVRAGGGSRPTSLLTSNQTRVDTYEQSRPRKGLRNVLDVATIAVGQCRWGDERKREQPQSAPQHSTLNHRDSDIVGLTVVGRLCPTILICGSDLSVECLARHPL